MCDNTIFCNFQNGIGTNLANATIEHLGVVVNPMDVIAHTPLRTRGSLFLLLWWWREAGGHGLLTGRTIVGL